MKRVAMLVDHQVDGIQYHSVDVVDFPDGTAKVLIEHGIADDSKGAVAHRTDVLKVKPIVHKAKAEEKAPAAGARVVKEGAKEDSKTKKKK